MFPGRLILETQKIRTTTHRFGTSHHPNGVTGPELFRPEIFLTEISIPAEVFPGTLDDRIVKHKWAYVTVNEAKISEKRNVSLYNLSLANYRRFSYPVEAYCR